jgi:hypothetical protein
LALPAQAYNEENIAKLAEAKQVNNTAILELMQALGATEPEYKHSSAWVAGPVIGGVVAAALLAWVCYLVYTKYWVASTIPRLPVTTPGSAPNGSDANVRVHVPTSGAKYAVSAAAQVGVEERQKQPAATTSMLLSVALRSST